MVYGRSQLSKEEHEDSRGRSRRQGMKEAIVYDANRIVRQSHINELCGDSVYKLNNVTLELFMKLVILD